MLSLKQFLINVASSISTLMSTKVDMTTPLLNFDDTAVDTTTDDGALANALRALGILNDVIPSGGGLLYLKKCMAKASDVLRSHSVTVKDYSVTTGTSQYGGYYYGDVSVAIASASLIGYSVRQNDTNMPVILIRTRTGDIRAFSTQSNYTVDIRCIYLGILTN